MNLFVLLLKVNFICRMCTCDWTYVCYCCFHYCKWSENWLHHFFSTCCNLNLKFPDFHIFEGPSVMLVLSSCLFIPFFCSDTCFKCLWTDCESKSEFICILNILHPSYFEFLTNTPSPLSAAKRLGTVPDPGPAAAATHVPDPDAPQHASDQRLLHQPGPHGDLRLQAQTALGAVQNKYK